MIFKQKNNSGQAVLIVLLSLSVVLVIVLYVMSRSVTDISLSKKDEDSMRAFSAAEAGIERALVIGSGIDSTTIGNASFSASVSNFAQGADKMVYPVSLKSGGIATFWFSRPTEPSFTGNKVKLCWGALGTLASTTETPAVEITVFYKSTDKYKIARVALDPNSGRNPPNNFTSVLPNNCTIDTEIFQFQNTINFRSLKISGSDVLQFMTVKPLYNTSVSHKIGIDVSSTNSFLPSQGLKVNSDGSFADSNRSIEVYQLYAVAPSVFMNAIYSSSGIVK